MNKLKSIHYKKLRKHFAIFCIIQIVELLITYTLARKLNQDDVGMIYVGVSAIFFPIIITGIMIYTFKSNFKISYKERILLLIGIIFIVICCSISFNYVNIYDRLITKQDMIEGVLQLSYNSITTFVLGLVILYFFKSRLVSTNLENEIEEIGKL